MLQQCFDLMELSCEGNVNCHLLSRRVKTPKHWKHKKASIYKEAAKGHAHKGPLVSSYEMCGRIYSIDARKLCSSYAQMLPEACVYGGLRTHCTASALQE